MDVRLAKSDFMGRRWVTKHRGGYRGNEARGEKDLRGKESC